MMEVRGYKKPYVINFIGNISAQQDNVLYICIAIFIAL